MKERTKRKLESLIFAIIGLAILFGGLVGLDNLIQGIR
jgi:hypothetical protein